MQIIFPSPQHPWKLLKTAIMSSCKDCPVCREIQLPECLIPTPGDDRPFCSLKAILTSKLTPCTSCAGKLPSHNLLWSCNCNHASALLHASVTHVTSSAPLNGSERSGAVSGRASGYADVLLKHGRLVLSGGIVPISVRADKPP